MRHNLQPHYHEYLEFESSNVSAEHPQTKEIIDVTQFSGSFNGIYFQWNDNEKLSSMDWVLEMIVKADEMKEKLVPPEAKSTPSAETHEEKKKNLRKHSHDKDDHKDDHKDEHKDGHSSNCILQ